MQKGFARHCKQILLTSLAVARLQPGRPGRPSLLHQRPPVSHQTGQTQTGGWEGGGGWHFTNITAQYWLQSTTGKNNQVMMAAMFIAGLLDGCLVSARKLVYH